MWRHGRCNLGRRPNHRRLGHARQRWKQCRPQQDLRARSITRCWLLCAVKQKLANLMPRSYKQQLKGSVPRQRPASQLWPLVGSALKFDSLNELGSSSTLLATFLSVLLSLVTASAQQGALAFFTGSCLTDSSVARLVVLLLRHPSRSSDSDFCKRLRPVGRFVARA